LSELSLADFWSLFAPSIIAAVVAALLCGVLGVFVVLRRVAFVAAALGQLSGLGVATGFLLGTLFGLDPHERTPWYLDPVLIALVLSASVAAALSYVSRVQRTSPESTVAFAYLSASALAIIVLASPKIVQEAHEVGDLLFGNTVAVRHEHLLELGVVAGVVLLSQVFLFKDYLFISFDGEMARTLGLPVTALDMLLNLSIGVSVTVATRALGALPVFGFLVLPAGAALLASESVRGVLILSVTGAVVAAGLGFYLSAVLEWPTGPMMVVVAAAYWPLAALWRLLRRER
jgi:zinc transport system permease protein